MPVALAKAVADCGHGGMVLCSQAAFERLPLDALSARAYGVGHITHMCSVLSPRGVYQYMPQMSSWVHWGLLACCLAAGQLPHMPQASILTERLSCMTG